MPNSVATMCDHHVSPAVPGPPSISQTSASGPGQINVTWEVPAEPNGILISYTLQYRIMDTTATNMTIPASPLFFTLEGLDAGTEYKIMVAGETSVGMGNFSSPVLQFTISNPPLITAAVQQSTSGGVTTNTITVTLPEISSAASAYRYVCKREVLTVQTRSTVNFRLLAMISLIAYCLECSC